MLFDTIVAPATPPCMWSRRQPASARLECGNPVRSRQRAHDQDPPSTNRKKSYDQEKRPHGVVGRFHPCRARERAAGDRHGDGLRRSRRPTAGRVGRRQRHDDRHDHEHRWQVHHSRRDGADAPVQVHRHGAGGASGWHGERDRHPASAGRGRAQCDRRHGARPDRVAARARHGAADRSGIGHRRHSARKLHQRAAGTRRRRRRDQHIGRTGRVDIDHDPRCQLDQQHQSAADDRGRAADRQQDDEHGHVVVGLSDLGARLQQSQRRLHESGGGHQSRRHRVADGAQGARSVGALRYRRRERRDRHHDETRPRRRRRIRIQQQLPPQRRAGEARHSVDLRPERHAEHLRVRVRLVSVLRIRRIPAARPRTTTSASSSRPEASSATTCRSAAARRTDAYPIESPQRRPRKSASFRTPG